MEHVNKQLGVNFDLFEKNNSSPKPKPYIEGFNIIALILLGCGGLYIYTSTISPKEPSSIFSRLTTNQVLNKPEKKGVKSTRKAQLSVEGHQEAGEKIRITIEGFDEKAWYTLDFGDGNTKTVHDESIGHVYREPGDYILLLKVGYENEAVQRISKKIYIDQPIEVDSDAYFEK